MRTVVLWVTVLALILTSCSGAGTSNDDNGETGNETASDSGLDDPCSLIDQDTLDTYFDEPVEAEPGGSDPFLTCEWSDSNANSVLVMVSESDSVNRPETCPDCLDLDFGDDGYATGVSLQSTAEFVIGDRWFAVTTTGLGDDAGSIAALARRIFEQVS